MIRRSDVLIALETMDEVGLVEGLVRLQEARNSSVMMLVVEPSIPGKNLVGFIRQLSTDRSRIVVGVLSRRKQVVSAFGRALLASLPDVQKKLHFVEADPRSLRQTVDAAIAEKAYRSGQVLEIVAEGEVAAEYQRDISSWNSEVDNSVMVVRPMTVPQDDQDAIRKALSSQDLQSMHRVLDPHMFSDRSSLNLFKQAVGPLLHRPEPSVKEFSNLDERTINEFLTDVAPSRKEGQQLLTKLMKGSRALLSRRGLDIAGASYLGTGSNGSAWKLRDGRVLKITTDDAEARIGKLLQGMKLRHVSTVYDVWAFPDTYNGHRIYGLVTEEGLQKPTEGEREAFDDVIEILEDSYDGADLDLARGDIKKVLDGLMRSKMSNTVKAIALRGVKEFDLVGICSDLKRLRVLGDIHSGNFMARGDGTFVLIDIGTAGDETDNRPPDLELDDDVPDDRRPMVEMGSGSPASGMNGPMRMRSSNSSSWALGRFALKDPKNFIPEEDAEDEGHRGFDRIDQDRQ
jgi:hypothetical protein